MFEDDQEREEERGERVLSPEERAKEKAGEFRMYAQIAAVFEGTRKFGAEIRPLDAEAARTVQKGVARLERQKEGETPVIKADQAGEARQILEMAGEGKLATGDYHVYRRPGEVMVVRWLAGEQVATFYERLQAHFEAGLDHYRKEERQASEWKADPATLAYLDALDKVEMKMADWYLRDTITQHQLYVLSTQAADELDILYLCDYVMGVEPWRLVGRQAAPPEEGATEGDRAWYFKLFSLRGLDSGGGERMCFFAYMQKAEETFGGEE